MIQHPRFRTYSRVAGDDIFLLEEVDSAEPTQGYISPRPHLSLVFRVLGPSPVSQSPRKLFNKLLSGETANSKRRLTLLASIGKYLFDDLGEREGFKNFRNALQRI